MGWTNVPICDDHWVEEEGNRQPVRLNKAVRPAEDPCYRCGRQTHGIYVRRNVPDAAGLIEAACPYCHKAVNSNSDGKACVIVLGITYDDIAVCIAFHEDCFRKLDRVYVPPRKSDGMSLIDAIDENAVNTLDDLYGDHDEADYAGSQPDRIEDA